MEFRKGAAAWGLDRSAKLYKGFTGYVCRARVGNPAYASQAKSSQAGNISRRASRAFDSTARLFSLGRFRNGRAECTGEHMKGLSNGGTTLEAGLSRHVKSKTPDYANLVAQVL